MSGRARAAALLGCCLAAGFAAAQRSAPPPGAGTEFVFAALGDTPYTADEEARFIGMLAEINRAAPAFVVHVGDFKSGQSECSDALFRQRLEWFGYSRQPFVFVPGDNDWTDCWRPSAGGHQPLERLARLRKLFFAEPRTLGQRPIEVERQPATTAPHPYPEHARWALGRVLFVTLNVPGGDNNFTRDHAEFRARDAAARAWIRDAFRLARRQKSAGIVIMMQANPWAAAGARRRGFAPLVETLLAETREFAGEVALIHGDTHRFRVDQPLADPATQQRVPNFTRIEVFGSPTVNWVRVSVTEDGGRVTFRAEPGG
jgi:hypothetical protein